MSPALFLTRPKKSLHVNEFGRINFGFCSTPLPFYIQISNLRVCIHQNSFRKFAYRIFF